MLRLRNHVACLESKDSAGSAVRPLTAGEHK